MTRIVTLTLALVAFDAALAQGQGSILLKPARVFDGVSMECHSDWVVVVKGERIESVGPSADIQVSSDARVIDLPGATLLPGLIEAHSHLYLHPYNETSWDDQVLKESFTLRVCRATQHARATLQARSEEHTSELQSRL